MAVRNASRLVLAASLLALSGCVTADYGGSHHYRSRVYASYAEGAYLNRWHGAGPYSAPYGYYYYGGYDLWGYPIYYAPGYRPYYAPPTFYRPRDDHDYDRPRPPRDYDRPTRPRGPQHHDSRPRAVAPAPKSALPPAARPPARPVTVASKPVRPPEAQRPRPRNVVARSERDPAVPRARYAR